MSDFFGFVTLTCPRCGKEFERLSANWTYRISSASAIKYFCSYTCWRAEQEDIARRKRERTHYHLSAEEKVKLRRMLDEGRDIEEIARILKVTEICIMRYRKTRK
jgi:transposase-like protein